MYQGSVHKGTVIQGDVRLWVHSSPSPPILTGHSLPTAWLLEPNIDPGTVDLPKSQKDLPSWYYLIAPNPVINNFIGIPTDVLSSEGHLVLCHS